MFRVLRRLFDKKRAKIAVILRQQYFAKRKIAYEESQNEILPVGQDDKGKVISKNTPFTIHHSLLTNRAQVILEFTFCMIIVMFMIYGLMKVFQWTGLDLAERRSAHDNLLIAPIVQSYVNAADGPLKQIDPYFYTPVKMNAIWGGG